MCKCAYQVEGKDGIEILMKKIERKGLGVLYAGRFFFYPVTLVA
jgi:hypothetical protein